MGGLVGRWVAIVGRWVAIVGRWVAIVGRWVAIVGRWVAKLEAHLLATAALWVQIQTSLKNRKWST
jgi:hypothetical protein